MSGNHGFPAEFHIRISGLVKGCKQWELCVYLYFGGTLPGHGERKTLEVSLQTEVFRLPAPSRARAALRAAGTDSDEEDFGEALDLRGCAGYGEAGSPAAALVVSALLFPGVIPADPGVSIFIHWEGEGGEVEKQAGGIKGR